MGTKVICSNVSKNGMVQNNALTIFFAGKQVICAYKDNTITITNIAANESAHVIRTPLFYQQQDAQNSTTNANIKIPSTQKYYSQTFVIAISQVFVSDDGNNIVIYTSERTAWLWDNIDEAYNLLLKSPSSSLFLSASEPMAHEKAGEWSLVPIEQEASQSIDVQFYDDEVSQFFFHFFNFVRIVAREWI